MQLAWAYRRVGPRERISPVAWAGYLIGTNLSPYFLAASLNPGILSRTFYGFGVGVTPPPIPREGRLKCRASRLLQLSCCSAFPNAKIIRVDCRQASNYTLCGPMEDVSHVLLQWNCYALIGNPFFPAILADELVFAMLCSCGSRDISSPARIAQRD